MKILIGELAHNEAFLRLPFSLEKVNTRKGALCVWYTQAKPQITYAAVVAQHTAASCIAPTHAPVLLFTYIVYPRPTPSPPTFINHRLFLVALNPLSHPRRMNSAPREQRETCFTRIQTEQPENIEPRFILYN